MEDGRLEIIVEVLRERLPAARRVVEEWSVPGPEALTYSQAKDLIWQVAAPFGLAMLGYTLAERLVEAGDADLDLLASQGHLAHVGEETGALLDRLLRAADQVRP